MFLVLFYLFLIRNGLLLIRNGTRRDAGKTRGAMGPKGFRGRIGGTRRFTGNIPWAQRGLGYDIDPGFLKRLDSLGCFLRR